MNPTLETIYSRRAVRKYKTLPVTKKIIDQVIDAGRMAPSAINAQPWKFYILTDQDFIATLSKETAYAAAKEMLKGGVKGIIKSIVSVAHFPAALFKRADPIFHGAPVVIFITSPRDNEWASLDIGMCAQNMMLAAQSLNLCSCPVGLAKFVSKTKSFSEMKVSQNEQVELALIIGYGDETPPLHPRNKTNAFYIDPLK